LRHISQALQGQDRLIPQAAAMIRSEASAIDEELARRGDNLARGRQMYRKNQNTETQEIEIK
jgi:hypothetical protein